MILGSVGTSAPIYGPSGFATLVFDYATGATASLQGCQDPPASLARQSTGTPGGVLTIGGRWDDIVGMSGVASNTTIDIGSTYTCCRISVSAISGGYVGLHVSGATQ